ncbi:MAG: sugar phosphate isomerase/epimerase [Opitutaceae bacterium]|nr:sugar phosphate isomerase/epimerase [Opitutaceae bacterium]
MRARADAGKRFVPGHALLAPARAGVTLRGMHRRAFLHSTSALAALATLPVARAAAPKGRRKFTLALTPGSIGVSVKSQRELNDLAHRHRFESVEPRGEELAGLAPAQVDDILADLKAKQLSWSATGLPVDFRKDDATFREGLARLPRIAAALRAAGSTRIGTWLAPSHDQLTYNQNFKQHAARLREVARILADHGQRLGLEYVGTQLLLVGKRYPFVHTLAEARELIAAIGAPNVGLVLDTWHWWTAGDTTADLLALKNEDVISVDLNDAPLGVAKEQQRDNARELPAATGVIDAAAFVNALVQIGYDGPVRPEPFNAVLNALDNEAACAATSTAMHKAAALVRA